jgi:magnesium-transporting ATPase (P-type)
MAKKVIAMPFSALPADEVATALRTDRRHGLSDAEAAARFARTGPNEIRARERESRLRLLLGQFRDALVWVLLLGAAVSGLLLAQWVDALVILAIVLINGALGFLQESRAANALERLRELGEPPLAFAPEGSSCQSLKLERY